VTNNHVVTSAKQLTVTLATDRTVQARLVAVDPVDDLAVIKGSAQTLPVAHRPIQPSPSIRGARVCHPLSYLALQTT
jgi:S1-C subfamily serine protease